MGVIRDAYPIGVPALIVKSQTDRLGSSGGYAFHLGTPDDILRRICSWLLTKGKADAVLAASIFHFKEFTIGETKRYLKSKGIPVRI